MYAHPPPTAPGAAGLGWWLVPGSVPRSILTAEDGWGPGTPTAPEPQENPAVLHLQGPPGGFSRDPGAGSGCSGLGPAGPRSAARGQGAASQADPWGLRSACHPTRVSGVHADDVHATSQDLLGAPGPRWVLDNQSTRQASAGSAITSGLSSQPPQFRGLISAPPHRPQHWAVPTPLVGTGCVRLPPTDPKQAPGLCHVDYG